MSVPKTHLIYDMMDEVREINEEVRSKAFNAQREDLWRLYEIGHQCQLALAAYVVGLQQAEDML